MQNTHRGVLLLVKLQAEAYKFTKSNIPRWVFITFLELWKLYQIAQNFSFIRHCRGKIVLGRTHPCKVDMQCHPPTLLFSKCGTSRVKRFFEEGETGSSLIYSKINFQIKLKLIPQQEFLSFLSLLYDAYDRIFLEKCIEIKITTN